MLDKNYRHYLAQRFPGKHIRKLCLNAGFSCPNITDVSSGCSYCNNDGFAPRLRTQNDLCEQWDRGRRALRRRHRNVDAFIAYFQAFSNTYASPATLRELYDPLPHIFDECVGASISTRPDCLDDGIIHYLDLLGQRLFLTVEIGLQSDRDAVLKRINRGHDLACFLDCIERCRHKSFDICVHFMIGLPGEGSDVGKRLGEFAAGLPINSIKLHNLHIMKNTPYERAYRAGTISAPSQGFYLQQAGAFIRALRPDQYIQRIIADAPADILVSDDWCSRKQDFLTLLNSQLRNTCEQHNNSALCTMSAAI